MIETDKDNLFRKDAYQSKVPSANTDRDLRHINEEKQALKVLLLIVVIVVISAASQPDWIVQLVKSVFLSAK